jgi:hypothetical protein
MCLSNYNINKLNVIIENKSLLLAAFKIFLKITRIETGQEKEREIKNSFGALAGHHLWQRRCTI